VKQILTSRRLLFFAVVVLVFTNMAFAAVAQCDRAKQQQAIAALGPQVKIEFDRNHLPLWISGQIGQRTSEDAVESAIAVLKARADVFCASADDGFVFSGRISREDKLGQTHVRINQTYRGFDVIGPELIVHMTRDSLIIINGHFTPGISLPTEAILSSQEASRIALERVAQLGGINGTVREVRALLVFVDRDDKAYLAYPVKVGYGYKMGDRYKRGPHVDDVFVDAIAGAVAGVDPLIIKD
jgi:Zn-dependent metalloprotease